MAESVLDLCAKVRGRLIDDSLPLFAVEAYNLNHIEDEKVETAETDGTRIWFNPEFWIGLQPEERIFVYAHEVIHCTFQDPYRCGDRDITLWNIVCDWVNNHMLIKDKVGTPPKGVLICPSHYLDKDGNPFSKETIYAIEEKKAKEKGDKPGDKGGDGEPKNPLPGCPTGSFKPAPEPGDEAHTPEDKTPGDWDISLEKAMLVAAAEGRENTRGGSEAPDLNRLVAEARKSKTDWMQRLWAFAEKTIPSETTWSTPNRRLLVHDLYLPSVSRRNMPKLGLGADTSGSISQDWIDLVQFQVQAVNTQLRPREIEVIYCNSEIQGVDVFHPEDEVILNAKGGGGTSDMDFWPIITYFNEKDDDEKPSAVIVFTDLFGKVPPEPDYPVLWIVPEYSTQPDPPYGETVRMSLH